MYVHDTLYNFQAHYHEALNFRSFHDGHIIMYVLYISRLGQHRPLTLHMMMETKEDGTGILSLGDQGLGRTVQNC